MRVKASSRKFIQEEAKIYVVTSNLLYLLTFIA